MNETIQKIKSCLENNSESLLNLLCLYYTQEHSFENKEIQEHLQELNKITEKLSVPEGDRVFDLLWDLCEEFMDQTFLTGVQFGIRLVSEMQACAEK